MCPRLVEGEAEQCGAENVGIARRTGARDGALPELDPLFEFSGAPLLPGAAEVAEGQPCLVVVLPGDALGVVDRLQAARVRHVAVRGRIRQGVSQVVRLDETFREPRRLPLALARREGVP